MDRKKIVFAVLFSILTLVLVSVVMLLPRQEDQTPIQSGPNVFAEDPGTQAHTSDPQEHLTEIQAKPTGTQEHPTGIQAATLPGPDVQTDAMEPPEENTSVPPHTETGSPDDPTEGSDGAIALPYAIPGSSLLIEQINPYDGPFFEDGSDQEVSNVTAIVVRNTGDTCIEYAGITMERDGTQLRFVASTLAPDSAAVVLEADRKQFREGEYTNCFAEFSQVADLEMSSDQVRVEETGEGGIRLTNISQADIPCVRIFYKFYMRDMDVYIGGITYTAKVVALKADQSCVVNPSHYVQGYSRIVMVKTYETDD